jgi:hypothetical protein
MGIGDLKNIFFDIQKIKNYILKEIMFLEMMKLWLKKSSKIVDRIFE